MIGNKFNSIYDSAWGSSAKGAASSRLADIFDTPNLSSLNYPNAGHTYINGEYKFVGKILPTGAALKSTVLATKVSKLWVGPNSGIERQQLRKELSQTGYSLSDVNIHPRAMIVEQRHRDAEAQGGTQSTLRISSTMSGSGAAYTDKAMRQQDVELWGELHHAMTPMEYVYAVRAALQNGSFLHEVSQGFALSLNHGTHYPFCTFRDCTPQQAYADFGILPSMVGDVYMNVRTFPIRVGNNYDSSGVQIGYSGDVMSDQHEVTWAQVGKEAEMPQYMIDTLSEREKTTVTKKVRRVFDQSWQLLKESADFGGATKLILNFPQYLHWSAYKVRGGRKEFETMHPLVRAFVDKMEVTTNLPVVMIGTGPDHNDYVYLK